MLLREGKKGRITCNAHKYKYSCITNLSSISSVIYLLAFTFIFSFLYCYSRILPSPSKMIRFAVTSRSCFRAAAKHCRPLRSGCYFSSTICAGGKAPEPTESEDIVRHTHSEGPPTPEIDHPNAPKPTESEDAVHSDRNAEVTLDDLKRVSKTTDLDPTKLKDQTKASYFGVASNDSLHVAGGSKKGVRPLFSRIQNDAYDVVIVGGGVSGLTLAASLS